MRQFVQSWCCCCRRGNAKTQPLSALDDTGLCTYSFDLSMCTSLMKKKSDRINGLGCTVKGQQEQLKYYLQYPGVFGAAGVGMQRCSS